MMAEQVQTYQQVIDLTFRLNEASISDVESRLRRSGEDRAEIFRTAYGTFSELGDSFRRNREEAQEQYLTEFSASLKDRSDLTEQQVEELEKAERVRVAQIMDVVERGNSDLLAVTSALFMEEGLAREDTVKSMMASDSRVRELRRAASGEKEDEEGGGFWSNVYDSLNKVVGVLHSMGMPIASLTVEEIGRFAVASYEHRIRERKAEYQMAAAGGQLTPSGASFDMEAYTDGIRELRQKFPSLREEFDNIALSLRRQMPDMSADEVIALVDDVRRLSFYTGESMETLAGEMGTLARKIRVPSSEIAGKMLWMTELGRFYSRSNNLNIDIGKFRSNIINLADQNKQYGMSVEEAAGAVFRFAKELDKGVLSLEDIAALTLGYSRTTPTMRAFMGEQALEWMRDRSEFEDLKSILSRVAQNPVALSETLRGIASKSESTYRRIGAYDIYYKDRDRLAQQAAQAMMGGIKLYADRVGGSVSEVNFFWRDFAQKAGMLRGDLPIGPAQKLLETGLEGIDSQSVDAVAAKAVSRMNDWRTLVDENQDLTESHLEQLWEMMRMTGAALMEFTDGMSNTASDLIEKIANVDAVDYLGDLGKAGVAAAGSVTWGEVMQGGKDAMRKVEQKSGELANEARGTGEEMMDAAKGWAAREFVEGVVDVAEGAREWFQEKLRRIKSINWFVRGEEDEAGGTFEETWDESGRALRQNESGGVPNSGSAGMRRP